MQIKHYKHSEIDFKKWNAAIDSAINGLVYAKSWYLDIVSPNWEVLIFGDYEFIMPLPVKNKFGIKYLVQPTLTQQLGVFSRKPINKKAVDLFIKNIPYFSYELNLNEQNRTSCVKQNSLNLLLDLSTEFSELEQSFSKNTIRNINNAKKNGLTITENFSSNEFLDFYFGTEVNFSKPNRLITEKLINKAVENQAISIFAAKNQNNQVVAAFCLLKSGKRLINLLPVSNDEGKRTSAMFLLIENAIELHSGSNKTLDFEGSMIEGVARFYKGFGAKEKFYPLIKRFRPNFLIEKL
ncbi:MAG TPA: peptidoglycan bridge formation glycyltransferase FemA/FemB family protein [Bacteroidales bacterium]|nr:peptidoglycan bridge formation glycyltransferase FemA/FemB family protein [Bacteroidales bacterium]